MKDPLLTRLCLGITIGLAVAGLMMLAQYLVEGIDPLDRWDHAKIYGFFGVTIGMVVGMIWGGIAGASAPPDQVNTPVPDSQEMP
jgi:MFS family permease